MDRQYLPNSNLSSSTPTRIEAVRTAAVRGLIQSHLPLSVQPDLGENEARQRMVPDTRACQLPIPIPPTATASRPAPYTQNLTPVPSTLHPHCLAKDWLRKWTPARTREDISGDSAINTAEWEHIKDTMVYAWEEETNATYRSGILMWHCFCDSKGVSEQQRAPASQEMLSVFVSHMATIYSGKTISNYLSGVRSWHILHRVPWELEKR